MDELTKAAAEWVARDEPDSGFYRDLYRARRKQGLTRTAAVNEIADYMRQRMIASMGVDSSDAVRIDWTAIARECELEAEFLDTYRQLGGRQKYETRQYLKKLYKEEQAKKRGKVINHDFTIQDNGQ